MIAEKQMLSEAEALRILAEIAEAEAERTAEEPRVELDELAEFIGYERARRVLGRTQQ